MSKFAALKAQMDNIDDSIDDIEEDEKKNLSSGKKKANDKITDIRGKKEKLERDELSDSDLAPSADYSVGTTEHKGIEEIKFKEPSEGYEEGFDSDGSDNKLEVAPPKPTATRKESSKIQDLSSNDDSSDSEDEFEKGLKVLQSAKKDAELSDSDSDDGKNKKNKKENEKKDPPKIQEFKIGQVEEDGSEGGFSSDGEEKEAKKEEKKETKKVEKKESEDEIESEYGSEKYLDEKVEKEPEKEPPKIQEFKIGQTEPEEEYDGFSSEEEKPTKPTKQDKSPKKSPTKPKPEPKSSSPSKSPTRQPAKVTTKTSNITKTAAKMSETKKQNKQKKYSPLRKQPTSKSSSKTPSKSPLRQATSKTPSKSPNRPSVSKQTKPNTKPTSKATKASKTSKLNQDLMAVEKPDEFKLNDQKDDYSDYKFHSEIEEDLNEEEEIISDYKSGEKQSSAEIEGTFGASLLDSKAVGPNIKEFKINDQASETSFKQEEAEETIRDSIYESVEKSTRLKEMAVKKYGVKERPKVETESSIVEEVVETRSKAKPPIGKGKSVKRADTESRGSHVRGSRKDEANKSDPNIKEFKISDGGSNIGYEGFSENPSSGPGSPAPSEEKRILANLPSKHTTMKEKKAISKAVAKNYEIKKKKQDVIGPTEFRIGDDNSNDPTEGFASVSGVESPSQKEAKKKSHKKAKDQFKSKVKDYKAEKQHNATPAMSSNGDRDNFNPKEFVLRDSGSQAVDDDFASKEQPSYADNVTEQEAHEKSIEMQSMTSIRHQEEEESQISEANLTHATEAINPGEIQFNDNRDKYDERDFSNNSQSNCAKGINKNLKRQKKLEQRFEKQHQTKLNKDLDIHSEQSVRLGEGGKKTRPKTAYKEKHKPDEPGVGEIALPVRRNAPVTQEKEVEIARRKLFKKLKEDKAKKKQIIDQAVKKHVVKAPKLEHKKPARPKTAKKGGKEMVIDENNENDYEQFLNGPRKPPKDPKKVKKEQKLRKKEQEWVGIGLGTGKFGEEHMQKERKRKKESRSIFNMPPPKQEEEEYDYDAKVDRWLD